MIITKLMGGLGNQMFQYAAGKALAWNHGVECKTDLSFLNADPKGLYTQRKFELDIFQNPISVIKETELKNFLVKHNSQFNILLNKAFPFVCKNHFITEKGHQYQSDFFNTSKDTYISGFWQSEKYFKNHESKIREVFTIKKNLIEDTHKWLDQIKHTNSVSVHIRRGDYINLSSANSFHGICSNEYYEEALKFIGSKIKEIVFFVFSDDIEWCKANFKINFPVHFVETDSAYKEMYLMQNCVHNIIANSSFSWWSAWLNSNENKIVIAPKKWFNDENINTKDIVPESWIKI